LMWLKRHAPADYDRIAHTLMINDWVLYRLCGEYASEPSNASETCVYDLATGAWADDLIDALGLPRGIFPPVLACGTVLGRLTASAAADMGLTPGISVVVGGADTQCGLVGCGAVGPGQVAAIAGTTTPVQMVTAQPVWDRQERLWVGAHVIPDRFVLESNAGSAGITYKWYRDTFCQWEMHQAAQTGASAYELMNAEAAKAPAGSGDIQSFVGVYLMNAKHLTAPKSIINFSRRSFSLVDGSQKSLVTRSILESLAYAVKANLDQLIEVSGVTPGRLHVCGGLSKSRLYLDIVAAVTRLPVQVPAWTEGSAAGAAICAGVGVGIFADFTQGVEALVKTHDVLPDAQLADAYAPLYPKWLSAFHSLAQASL
jgi:sugar (pentulose or hexulose) kinase